MNNTACLNGLGMTEAKKKHQLMLNNGKHVSKNMFVLVISLKKLSQKHQLIRIIFKILALPPKYYSRDFK
jgi:hypothetical protein